jgi:5-methylcytosine-specific restriction endonuclease McrA
VTRIEKGGRLAAHKLSDFGASGAGACELCGRFVRELTRHHLIPRSRHGKKRAKRTFERREMENRIALLCRPCHKNVHTVLDNKELEREYNSVEALATHPSVEGFTHWVRNKPHGVIVLGARGKVER